ncbi:MAG: hypothetical protein WCG45_05035 [bacterium]
MNKKTKQGRKPLPTEEKKTEVRFFIEQKHLTKNGGLETSIVKCKTLLSKLN